MRFSSINRPANHTAGFTLIEVLIIAPIVILSISGFVALMIAMVGDVLITRDHNTMAYETQDALDRIEQDTRISTQFLNTTRDLPSPQGKNDGTAPFTNVDGLIMGTLATDKNPLNSERQLIYRANQPNPCGPTQGQNVIFLNKIIYYKKGTSLWRRVIVPPYNTNPSVDTFTVCSTPWQQNTCSPGYTTSPPCQTNDAEVMKNVDTFSIQFFADAAGTTEVTGANILNASTVEVTLTGKKTTVGSPVTSSGVLRATKLNSIVADIPPPTTPSVTYDFSDPTNVNFSWSAVSGITSYKLSHQINGGSWTDTTVNSSTTSFTVTARRNDMVTLRVTSVNISGESPYGTATATLPPWTEVTPSNGWVHYSTPFATPAYTKTTDGVVALKGLIKSGNTANGTVIMTLPEGYRPQYRLIFIVGSYSGGTSGIGRIDVHSNGSVTFIGGTNNWISLDPIRFLSAESTGWTNLTFQNNWVNYTGGGGYSPLRVKKDTNTRVHVQGLVQGGTETSGVAIATMPANYAPPQHLIFPAADGTNIMGSFGVYNNNNIVARAMYTSYTSTQAIYYPATFNGWQALTPLKGGWIFYGSPHSTAQYAKGSDDIVVVKGLVKSGTPANGTVIATLPPGYRPKEKLLFTTVGNQHHTRIDVAANGDITIEGGGDAGWISLDPIIFIAEQ